MIALWSRFSVCGNRLMLLNIAHVMFNILGETLSINLATGVLLVTSHHLGNAYLFLLSNIISWTNVIIVLVCLIRLETD